MSFKKVHDPAPGSPYQQLRKNRPIKLDSPETAPAPLVPASLIPKSREERAMEEGQAGTEMGRVGKKANVWIKPKSNAVQVPPEVLELLSQDIERRHAGSSQAEEIVWYQDARPFHEAIRTSWAAGLALMLIIVSIFICIAIWFYVPSYLLGTALIPPIAAIISCAFLTKRIRVDLTGCYALTKNRAIIIVPRRHLGVLKPMVLNFDFLLEKNLIMVQMQEAKLQDQILSREPVLADLVHSPGATATVSFYPRTKFVIPFRFYNVQHSHAFEVDFTATMLNTPTPVNGGRLRVEKPDFEAQQKAAKRFKLYPILGAVWFLLIIGTISALLWGVFYTQLGGSRRTLTIAMVVFAWIFAVILSIAGFYPVYALSRQKRESIANNRYIKYTIDK